MTTPTKYLLNESQMPKFWYNIQADLPKALPAVLHPGTLQPIGPDDLAPLFPMELILQEVSTEREIEIPEPVRDIYRLWRPAPLYRAHRLEKALGTPAKIFYKYEGVSPAGSHKPNTAIPQAFYNKQAGIKRLTTETGAGQWGSSIAFAGQMFGLEVRIYMVKVSYDQKPYRRLMMQTWGGEVFASPSPHTETGRRLLAEDQVTGQVRAAATQNPGDFVIAPVARIVGHLEIQVKLACELAPEIALRLHVVKRIGQTGPPAVACLVIDRKSEPVQRAPRPLRLEQAQAPTLLQSAVGIDMKQRNRC